MCAHPQRGFYFLLKKGAGVKFAVCAWAVYLHEEAPIGNERAVSLCSPALLTSTLPTECAQRTGASLIPLIWGAPWDLTKHSSDKDTRSQRCPGIPTVGGRQTVCLWERGEQKRRNVFHSTWELWLDITPIETSFSPHLPFVNVCLRINAPNANQTGDHPLSPGPVCGFSTRLCFWSLTPDCLPLYLQGYSKLYSFYGKKKGIPLQMLDRERRAAGEMKKKTVKYQWHSEKKQLPASFAFSSQTWLLFSLRQVLCKEVCLGWGLTSTAQRQNNGSKGERVGD